MTIAIKRVQIALSSEIERKILVRLAKLMPSWISPDILTSIAFLAAVGIGISFVSASTWRPAYLIAVLLFVVHWFGDSLDGTLARVRKTERPRYGHYVDHFLDSISIAIILGSLTISALTGTAIWMGVLVGFLLIMIHLLLLASVIHEFHLSFGLFGPTESRFMGILLSIVLFLFGNPIIFEELRILDVILKVRFLDLVGISAAIAIWSVLIWRFVKTLVLLDKLDRKNAISKSARSKLL